MDTPPLRIGLFGIGLEAYWRQFAGLQERLRGYLGRVERKLTRPGVEVVDVIFLHVTTYALSSTVLPVVMRAKVPVIVLNLAPEPAIDYAAFNTMGDRTAMTGEWPARCSGCRRCACVERTQSTISVSRG